MGMMGTLSARWRAVLRLAWRDAVRHKGRTAVVVAMMMLPVFAATFLTTMIRSGTETTATMVQTRLGDEGQARLDATECERVEQDPVGGGHTCWMDEDPEAAPMTPEQMLALLPDGAALVPEYTGQGGLRSESALIDGTWTQVDTVAVPGLVPVRDGLAPGPGQTVVDARTAGRLGVGIGDDLDLVLGDGQHTVRIVGLAAPDRNPRMWLGAGSVPEAGEPAAWLVMGDPVRWAHVQALNETGVPVFSRQVALDPPPAEHLPEGVGTGRWDVTTVGLIGAVAAIGLVQAVLLIGPAFAVGARRSARTLALVAASGGRPRDLYRIVLASGLVAGGLAGLLGALLGLTAGVVAYLIATRMGFALANLVLPTWELVLIAGLALLVGLAAAWIPARGAASTDVVAALAGRRGEAAPRRRVPWVGLGLVAAGFGAALLGAVQRTPTLLVAGVLGIQLGLVMASGGLIALAARGASRLRAPARFALRDTQRQRGRTAPAVAAVLVAVAGATAGMSYQSSDAAASAASWVPNAQDGTAFISAPMYEAPREEHQEIYDETARIVADHSIDAEITVGQVLAGPQGPEHFGLWAQPDPDRSCPSSLGLEERRDDPRCGHLRPMSGWSWLSGPVVDDGALLGATGLSGSTEAARALADGKVVVTNSADLWPDGTARLEIQFPDGDSQVLTLPAHLFDIDTLSYHTVIPPQVLDDLDLAEHDVEVVTGGLMLTAYADFTTEEIDSLRLALAQVHPQLTINVEGWQRHGDAISMVLILAGLALAVALVATALSVGLAAAESRPDLATLAAVGAGPRVRRLVAGAQAGVIAVIGSVVGVLTGLLLAYVLTLWQQRADGWGLLWQFSVPWVVPVLAIALPVLAIGGAMLLTRSRLPMVRRVA